MGVALKTSGPNKQKPSKPGYPLVFRGRLQARLKSLFALPHGYQGYAVGLGVALLLTMDDEQAEAAIDKAHKLAKKLGEEQDFADAIEEVARQIMRGTFDAGAKK